MLYIYRNSDSSSIGKTIAEPPILEPMGTVGDRVREVREERGLTQKQLAKKAGIAQSALSELETGESHETAAIVKIAVALQVSAYWLDSGKPPKYLSELEAAILDLEDRDAETIMEMIRVMRRRKIA